MILQRSVLKRKEKKKSITHEQSVLSAKSRSFLSSLQTSMVSNSANIDLNIGLGEGLTVFMNLRKSETKMRGCARLVLFSPMPCLMSFNSFKTFWWSCQWEALLKTLHAMWLRIVSILPVPKVNLDAISVCAIMPTRIENYIIARKWELTIIDSLFRQKFSICFCNAGPNFLVQSLRKVISI